MIRLTDKALADIRADSEQGLPPGIGDTQLVVAEIASLKAECEGLRKIATELLSGARCDGLHHTKADLHAYDVPCKVLARIEAALGQGGQSNG